jgi:uncharacterized protein (TIGR03437 family)
MLLAMTRIALVALLIVVRLFAQGSASAIPSSIAITGDGSQVFFVSNLPLSGTQVGAQNVDTYSAGQAATIYQGAGSTCGNPPVGNCISGSAITGLRVSADGATFAVSQVVYYITCDADCQMGLPTGQTRSLAGVTLVTSSGITSYGSISGLSRNGRFVLHDCGATCNLTDLVQGRTQIVPFFAASVANDGTVASAVTAGTLSVWNPQSGVRNVGLSAPPGGPQTGSPIIDASASHVAIQTNAGTSIIDLLSGNVVTVPAALSFSSFSDSNSKILLTGKDSASASQAFIGDIDGTNFQQVTSEPTGIGSFAISSDASILVAVTQSGDMLRYDVAAGTREVLFGTPPQVFAFPDSGTPGSEYTVIGTALADGYAYAAPGDSLPISLGGIQVLVDGMPIPLIAVAPSSITCQLPWELTPGTHKLTVNRPVLSPLAAVGNKVSITAGNYPSFAAILHENWTPISSSQPAQEGEILHFYMTGLGPVTPSIATGEITPVGQLFTATGPNCSSVQVAKFDLLFAGLAPGLAGIYQVDIRISGLTSSTKPYLVYFGCGMASSSFYAQASSN